MVTKKYYLHVQYNENDLHNECKQLSQYVYHAHNSEPVPEGYEQLSKIKKDNGFYSEVFCKNNNVIIVVRGTQFYSLSDLHNDIKMTEKQSPSQLDSLMEVYNQVKLLKEYNPDMKIIFTGHSLGGSLSQMASMKTGQDAITFAPFGTADIIPEKERLYSKIINYGNEDDMVFNSRLNKQVGEVRIIERINNKSPHYIENWGPLESYINYTQNPNSNDIKKDIAYIKNKREFIKENAKLEHSERKSNNCVGSYNVSGYTREDGTKVQGYTRNCGAKHQDKGIKSKIPNLSNLPKEEVEWWMKQAI